MKREVFVLLSREEYLTQTSQHHSSCLSHNRGDLAAGLMAYAAACLKRVHPDSDLYNYFQGTHTKWQLVTMFLLSREAPSEVKFNFNLFLFVALPLFCSPFY